MQRLRASIRDHRHLALLALALAFLVRAALPAGYMVSHDASSVITIAVCSDASGGHKTTQLVVPAKPGAPAKGAKDGPCAFSTLAKSALGGADPILLALAFAFILVLGLASTRVLPARPVPHTQPPLRGPPALA
ncbi:MAG TPA: hypothetical protein VI168_05450 [Croceibacterium sp.]